ncbi:MAG: alpha-glucan family phosphorylase [Clostridia bacterium]|nr:alpha-glucan family phosphorylase [Clostridia bacterium]
MNVAYFTMELAAAKIGERFETYSGGLGVLAGDYFKQATEENRPITFLSILWKLGYARQKVEKDRIVDVPASNDKWQNFVTDTGLTTSVVVENHSITLKIWKFNDGNLYFLDADLPENGHYRYLTYNLYGGNEAFYGQEEKERILQEIILGIGGARALEVLNQPIDIYHFNDGHAIFAVHKLIKDCMDYEHVNFENALNKVKEKIRFTTHTNVTSGNEQHSIHDLLYLGAGYGLSYEQLSFLGGDSYGMTVAALRSAKKVNAVAKVHAEAANKLWEGVNGAPPIFPITNGVHRETWQHHDMGVAFETRNPQIVYEKHQGHKEELLTLIQNKNKIRLRENSLLIGFARRATSYKRWNLFAKDMKALQYAIEVYNVQFVFSGKCHPKDFNGRAYIQEIYDLSTKYPNNIVFLEGYDINLAKVLESGSDIWLNTPNGLEASGTSGMKAALNGAINFSTLDGWWKEAYAEGVNGFRIDMNTTCFTEEERNLRDCQSFYFFLFNEVLPKYQNRDICDEWENMMYASMQTATEGFTTKRMMAEYFEKLYS